MPASTGLKDDLAKLSTNTVETAENPEVDNIREDQREAVAGPGKGDRPDPKQAAKEKRKRKRQAAKAAAAATKAKAVVVASVVNNNDQWPMPTRPWTRRTSWRTTPSPWLAHVGVDQAESPRRPRGRRRRRLSTGSVISREGAGKHV